MKKSVIIAAVMIAMISFSAQAQTRTSSDQNKNSKNGQKTEQVSQKKNGTNADKDNKNANVEANPSNDNNKSGQVNQSQNSQNKNNAGNTSDQKKGNVSSSQKNGNGEVNSGNDKDYNKSGNSQSNSNNNKGNVVSTGRRSSDDKVNDANTNSRDKQQVKVDAEQKDAYHNPSDNKKAKIGRKEPQKPKSRTYSNAEKATRTNAREIVIQTSFKTKAEAASYIRQMLSDHYYTVDHYSTDYVSSIMTGVPTGYVNSTMFDMKYSFTLTNKGIRITLTSNWRKGKSGNSSRLLFQPDSNYDTFYAWNILEELASSIPHLTITYQK